MRVLLILALAACSNDVDPRVISGGGVGDGEIDGEVNVYVIAESGDAPISGAIVEVGGEQKTTDADGLVVFSDVEGAQTIAVKATGFRSQVWVGANGANVTIPLTASGSTPDSATLSGTITGWDTINPDTGHVKAAIILYSHSDSIGDDANDLQTPSMGNICLGPTCNWSVVSRTGTVTITAAIVDRDSKGTLGDPSDDTQKIIGWAFKSGVTVEKGVNQSGLTLTMVETGNLETVTIDKGTPPAGLTEVTAVAGIEVSKDDIVQLPAFINTDPTTLLAPKRTVFGGTGTYRLTAIAQTSSMDMGAQSIVLRQGLTTTTLTADKWLVSPTDVMMSRTNASWTPVSGAVIHSATWENASGELLEITVLDPKTTSVDVPTLVALPTSGTLTARVSAIGADIDPNDFSLEDDSAKIWGASAQPVSIP